jgi:hypothetical protein
MSLIEVETTGFPAARYSGVFVGLILVRIADSPEEFISAVSESLKPSAVWESQLGLSALGWSFALCRSVLRQCCWETHGHCDAASA